jgi:hypothetical protein
MGCLACAVSRASMPFGMRVTPMSQDFTHRGRRHR